MQIAFAEISFVMLLSGRRGKNPLRESQLEAVNWGSDVDEKQKRENSVGWRYSRHASSFWEWKSFKYSVPVNYSLACMSWDENCCRVSQFAIHLYERFFSAIQTNFCLAFSFFPFPLRGNASGLLMETETFLQSNKFSNSKTLELKISWQLYLFIVSKQSGEREKIFLVLFDLHLIVFINIKKPFECRCTSLLKKFTHKKVVWRIFIFFNSIEVVFTSNLIRILECVVTFSFKLRPSWLKR